jgi:hypothetical protein
VEVMATTTAGRRILIEAGGREDPLPSPFPRRARILPLDGRRQFDGAEAASQILVMLATNPLCYASAACRC